MSSISIKQTQESSAHIYSKNKRKRLILITKDGRIILKKENNKLPWIEHDIYTWLSWRYTPGTKISMIDDDVDNKYVIIYPFDEVFLEKGWKLVSFHTFFKHLVVDKKDDREKIILTVYRKINVQ